MAPKSELSNKTSTQSETWQYVVNPGQNDRVGVMHKNSGTDDGGGWVFFGGLADFFHVIANFFHMGFSCEIIITWYSLHLCSYIHACNTLLSCYIDH